MIRNRDLSLVYRAREAQSKVEGKPPLLVLLHGIGSNEDDLFAMTPYLDSRFFVVSARAPISLGPSGFAWFNIEFTPQGIEADAAQAERSGFKLFRFLDEVIERHDLDPSCVFLLGFSQGAMMGLTLGLVRPDKVAGVVSMSGRLPPEVIARSATREALQGLPVFVSHGVLDQVIPVSFGREARDALAALPVALTYREYPMGHEVTEESLRDATGWLREALDKCLSERAEGRAESEG